MFVKGLLAVVVALGLTLAYVKYQNRELDLALAEQALDLAALARERDNLRSELGTAQQRLAFAQKAQVVAADSLARAQAASRELASIKDWIRGNEDAPVPAWFDDLLVRLGFGLRDPAPEAGGAGPNANRP